MRMTLPISCALVLALASAQTPTAPVIQAASGTVTVMVNGQPIQTGAVLNFVSGANIIVTAMPDPAINGTDIGSSLNTAPILTKVNDQSGLNKFCHSVTNSTAFTCTLNASQALTALTYGTTIVLVADTSSNSTGVPCTLYIDSVGSPSTIYLKDGVTPATIIADEPYLIFWDGTRWRVIA